MDPAPSSLDLAELSAAADVSVRTIRYYIQQGLLPAPETRGPGAHYGPEHLDRLRLIRRLQREHLPLAEIRRRLDELSAAEIRRLADEAGTKQRSSARDYIRGVLSEPRAKLGERKPPASAPPEPAELFAALPALREARGEPVPSARLSSVRASVAEGSEPAAGQPVRRPTRSQWDRITLAPDVELHLRRPLSREQNRQVERLMEAARNIFEEDAT